MSTPPIPPRPSRSTQPASSSNYSHMEVPKIPPRPAKRSVDRSISPHRDTFARSPLNDPSFLHNQNHQHKESHLAHEVPSRPPSVTLPSLGQEGSEYASLEDLSQSLAKEERLGSPHQTKNVAGDLPLFAPKASVPSSTAKSRIQTVTRTDSSQAAAAIGKLAPEEKSPIAPDSGRSGSSVGTRPSSLYKEEEEQGIPEIGVQVPMYPNAGDVQAPTPSPYEQTFSTGGPPRGSHSSGRHHSRTRSGREIFHGPPGSYGLHGHGVIPKDEFEQQWYAKHPEDRAREQAGEYGPHVRQDRKDYHWVGDDLVKLVHSSAATGTGMGTSREAISTPDEQIGYLASEEYAQRMASPKPGRPASISSKSGARTESHLRHSSYPEKQGEAADKDEPEEEPEVIHIDPPSHHSSKVHGGGYDPPTEDLGPTGGNTEEEGGLITERGYGVPILASDEVQKHPEAEWRQPAVTPELERRASGEFTLNDPDGHPQYITKPRTSSRTPSRSSSRNNSKMNRLASPTDQYDRSNTPLESFKEYEPLFPDEDEPEKKPKNPVDKLKRPDHLSRHHFPSQDVWEDTPSSLQLQTTVETPQDAEGPYEEQANPDAGTVFEDVKHEEARKEQSPPEEQQSFLPERPKRFANKHLSKEHLAGSRPGQRRFPSHDIWEDAPEHGQLVTTVSTPQIDESNEYADSSPVVEKPSPFDAKPQVPARPQKETSPVEKKAVPQLPERPKPSVPPRPSKPSSTRSSEKVPTNAPGTEAPQPKPKPQVPARPAGSKIAALQSSFLKDLNSKLGLGPQAPKPKEPEPEKEEEAAPQPLQDARKGRAKGPQRRKPKGTSPAPAATVTAEVAVPSVKLDTSSITTIWSIGEDGVVDVPAAAMAEKLQAMLKPKEKTAVTEGKGEEKETGSDENSDEAFVDVAKEVPGGDPEAFSEQPALKKTDTQGSAKSTEPEEITQEDIPGAFPEKVDTPEPQQEQESEPEKKKEPEPTSSETEEPAHKPASEPVEQKSTPTDPALEAVTQPAKPEDLPPVVAKAAPTPSGPSAPVQTSEPVDMALMEEGKDYERREIGQ